MGTRERERERERGSKREREILYFKCLPDDLRLLILCGSLSRCRSVMWLFFMVPWVCLQCVIVVFRDLTHLLFMVTFHMSFRDSVRDMNKSQTSKI